MSETLHTCSEEAAPGLDLDQILDPALFRALGDPTRLTLLGRLAMASEPLTVTEVSSCCGVHLSGVSRHLKMLHGAGVVALERRGREVRYRLCCTHLSKVLRAVAAVLDGCPASKVADRAGASATS